MNPEWKYWGTERPKNETGEPFWGWSESQGVYWVYWNACYRSDTIPYPDCMGFTHWYPCDMTKAPPGDHFWERKAFGHPPAPPFFTSLGGS